MFTIEREQWLPRPLDEVFAFFSRPENLQEITPPWLDFRVMDAPQIPFPGALIRYRLRWHGIPLRWTSEITEWNPPHRFIDRAISGPYAAWNHEHSFTGQGNGTLVRDRVQYALPLGWLGVVAHKLRVSHDVERIFDFRAARMRQLFPA